jgi:hypothetical protein
MRLSLQPQPSLTNSSPARRTLHALTVASVAVFALLAPPGSASGADAGKSPDPLRWAAPTRENHPWTRWWWLGSAVDKTNLTRQLELFKKAGIGGVEICPIYGARGYEKRFLQYLSPQWMEMLAHTTSQAKRLGLGVDMSTGTGWPFGGARVTPEMASGRAVFKRFELAGGSNLTSALPDGRLQCLQAFAEDGTQIDLSGKVTDRHLDWTAPPGKWRLYAVAEVSPVQKVKRAAPGAEGNVLDPFSVAAMDSYLADFDQHFTAYHGAMPRSQFHDSYEYYNADWTPAFFTEFAARRGYDLRAQLPALFEEGDTDTTARVRTDYRETIADLHLAYIERWTAWSHQHGSLSRNQAHGSPANLLDVYAAADIPETEMMPFGGMKAQNYPLNKFSSSAAHDSGRVLASSESFTWLAEAFNASLSHVKQAADYLFLTGVNHIFFHGIPYSPADAPWPGWQFYAAVNFGPQGGLWRDLPEFNAYVTRCQSDLQRGASANDLLLYHNVYDIWGAPGNLLLPANTLPASLKDTALALLDRGYAYDYLSDRFLAQAGCKDGRVVLGANPARAILVPRCHLMPEASLEKLIDLARSGATILFVNNLPDDVPGLANLEKRRARFQALLGQIKLEKTSDPRLQKAALGRGAILVSDDLSALLSASGALREPMMDDGLWFVRRAHAGGFLYFLANRAEKPVDRWVTLGTPAKSAVLLDPRFANHSGMAAVRPGPDGATQVYLQLLPGESRILRTFTAKKVAGPAWPAFVADGPEHRVAGTWDVKFIEGGPRLPAAFSTSDLASWTSRDDPEAKRFAGTARYTTTFDLPKGRADDWVLDLGRVCETARVKINGREAGALWCAPFQMPVGRFLHPGKNTLELELTNLAANRIRDLDIRKVNWKYFYDANVQSQVQRGGLDASVWPLRDSGLLGPVNLRPVKKITPP